MPRRREPAVRFPISQEALVRRINRKLDPAARVRRNRGRPSRARWPEAWIRIDLTRQVIVGGVDLDALGRELGSWPTGSRWRGRRTPRDDHRPAGPAEEDPVRDPIYEGVTGRPLGPRPSRFAAGFTNAIARAPSPCRDGSATTKRSWPRSSPSMTSRPWSTAKGRRPSPPVIASGKRR